MDPVLQAFMDISQWKDSVEAAQAHIEAANGNLEVALALYYDGQVPSSTSVASSPEAASASTSNSGHSRSTVASHPRGNPNSDAASQSNAAPRKSLMEELNDEYRRDLVKQTAPRASNTPNYYSLRLLAPISLIVLALDKVVGTIYNWIAPYVPFPRLAHDIPPTDYFKTAIAPELKKFGIDSPFPGQFLKSESYNNALEILKKELKFLLVVLTSEVHSDPPAQFIRRILETKIHSRPDVFIWFGSALSTEGYRLTQAFKASQLPVAVLIGVSPKTANSSVIVMERLLNISGSEALASDKQIQEFTSDVDRIIQDHEPRLLSLKLHRQHNDTDRKIREDQDSAYHRSLNSDRQRAEKAREEEEERKLSTAKHAAWLALVKEKADSYRTAPSSEGARVSLRLPNGERLNLRVPGDAPVSDIYDITYAQLNKEEIAGIDMPEKQLEFNLTEYFPYKFTLMSTVLRGPLPCSSTKVEEVNVLWPSGVLMVDLD